MLKEPDYRTMVIDRISASLDIGNPEDKKILEGNRSHLEMMKLHIEFMYLVKKIENNESKDFNKLISLFKDVCRLLGFEILKPKYEKEYEKLIEHVRAFPH